MFETAAVSVIAILLFLLMLTRKTGRIKLLLGVLTAGSALVSMGLFLRMQLASGNPDAGKEFFQLYLPCGIYLVLALWGAGTAYFCRKSLAAKKEERS